MSDMKDTEIYAPNYHPGEKVALIRYPHGGTFEIPILTVNNNYESAKKMMGNAQDAVGINANVAARLSGADFDGDTVMVIPVNSKTRIVSTDKLKGLEGFDPKLEYGGKPEGSFKIMKNTQNEMGVISNLITDMTQKGATTDELARAVRHSMVVIDAEKHKLDYKQSEKDNDIKALKRKYQGHYDENGRYHEGVSTLISRAKSEKDVLKRKGSPKIDPETGELIWNHVTKTYIDKNGKTKVRTQKSTKMAEVKDAYELVSEANTAIERAYAEYANYMKKLANLTRKSYLETGKIAYSKTAKETYRGEVASLLEKLDEAERNRPRERKAQILANITVAAKQQENPGMTKEQIKKIKQSALSDARLTVGAHRKNIEITDKEWEAIQAGAISEKVLKSILKRTDIDSIRQRATPRENKNSLNPGKINQIITMNSSGYTTDEIAKRLGVSTTTIRKYLKGEA